MIFIFSIFFTHLGTHFLQKFLQTIEQHIVIYSVDITILKPCDTLHNNMAKDEHHATPEWKVQCSDLAECHENLIYAGSIHPQSCHRFRMVGYDQTQPMYPCSPRLLPCKGNDKVSLKQNKQNQTKSESKHYRSASCSKFVSYFELVVEIQCGII